MELNYNKYKGKHPIPRKHITEVVNNISRKRSDFVQVKGKQDILNVWDKVQIQKWLFTYSEMIVKGGGINSHIKASISKYILVN